MSFSLIQLNGPTPGVSANLDVDSKPVTIGRDPARDVPVDDDLCSRLHCRVWFDGQAWRVEDCGSRNGTFLNSRRIENENLKPGDAIRIGDRLFVFIEQGELNPAGWHPGQIENTTFIARIPLADQKDAVVGGLTGKGNPDSVRNAAILCRLAGELHEQDNIQGILKLVCTALDMGTQANAIVVWLTDSEGRLRRFGEKPDNKPRAASPLANLVMDQQEAYLVSQENIDSTMESTVIDDKPGSAICAPIPIRSGCRGAIEVIRNGLSEPFSQSNLDLAIAIARQAGLALENQEYRERLEQANVQLRSELVGKDRIIGSSSAISNLLDLVARVAGTQSTVLVTGESGTGKELVARMIHDSSSISSGPYVTVNCAAYSDALLESELFGHEKGAFTGADKQHLGQFERAHRGTIFLDEVGEMSLTCQAKLLRIIEGHAFERVGGSDSIAVEVRIVAATHRHLKNRVIEGEFREDLLFRLCVIELNVPPLRDREDDILILARHFLDRYRSSAGRGPSRFSAAARQTLLNHQWPGNVRELKNAVERAAVLGASSEIEPQDLGIVSAAEMNRESRTTSSDTDFIGESLADAELRHIIDVMSRVAGNKSKACRILGIGRGTLYKKLAQVKERWGKDWDEL
jgi:DNA-binding NtrC family response regulator